MVAALCERIGVSHRILARNSPPRSSNVQAWARELRYDLLRDWAIERDLDAIATAHHLDDQAETLLMRLARGSGIGGLAAVQQSRSLAADVKLVRPVLGWRRAELRRIVDEAGLEAVDDPSNADERFDRSRARTLLEAADWVDPQRIAAVASHALDAEQALAWAAEREFERRHSRDTASLTLDPRDLPRELKRRLLVRAIELMTQETPPGPKLTAALEMLQAGGTTTLAGLKLEGGARWRLSPAPPRRH